MTTPISPLTLPEQNASRAKFEKAFPMSSFIAASKPADAPIHEKLQCAWAGWCAAHEAMTADASDQARDDLTSSMPESGPKSAETRMDTHSPGDVDAARPALVGAEPDDMILKLSIDALTKHFNAFIGACMDTDGNPTAPARKALMQARACLPTSASHSFNPAPAAPVEDMTHILIDGQMIPIDPDAVGDAVKIDFNSCAAAPVVEAKPVAWAVTAERGGIHKLAITRESAERKAARWLDEWPNNGCKVRPLVFGDAAEQAKPSPVERPRENEYEKRMFHSFKFWAGEHLGQGYSLDLEDGSFADPVTRWAFIAYKAGIKRGAVDGEAAK